MQKKNATMKTLVIPDIHGRDFWKDAKGFTGEIIFLGDYHDPYPEEFNTDKDYLRHSLDNFLEIIDFAKRNSNVSLLLGNHDFHYIYPDCDSSRKDLLNCARLHDIFTENQSLFHWARRKGNVLFTHAGVCQEWLNKNPSDIADIEERINNATKQELMQTSVWRGGYDDASSPIWLDVREMAMDCTPYEELFQVFGHSQLGTTGSCIKQKNWADIDSRVIFGIDTNAEKSIETLKCYEREKINIR